MLTLRQGHMLHKNHVQKQTPISTVLPTRRVEEDAKITYDNKSNNTQKWARSPPFGDLKDQDQIIQNMWF